jgi:hypothetical protein
MWGQEEGILHGPKYSMGKEICSDVSARQVKNLTFWVFQ